MKKLVAHYLLKYLGLSETFIYQIVKHHKNWQPLIFAKQTENLEKFPIKNIYSPENIKKYSWWWMRNHLEHHLLSKNEYFENISYFKYYIKKSRSNLIHAHFGPAGVDMLPIKKVLNLPLVTNFYGYDMSELPKKKEWREKYMRLFSEGELFLVEGPNMKKKLAEIGCPLEKIKIQKISIDLNKISFKERRLKNNEKVKLLFCGRFVEKKGLIYALQAVKNVYNSFSNLEFRIIGDGRLKPEIVSFIKDNNMEKYVKLLGYQPYSITLKEIYDSHILIQPSVTAENGDSEGGAPTILIEAQASGMPVLSTYHADIPEVVNDGESSYLVPEKDVNQLSNKLLQLINSKKDWVMIGKKGCSFVEREHNIRTSILQLEKIYDKFI